MTWLFPSTDPVIIEDGLDALGRFPETWQALHEDAQKRVTQRQDPQASPAEFPKPRFRRASTPAAWLTAGQRVRVKYDSKTEIATIDETVHDPGSPWNQEVFPPHVYVVLACSDGRTRIAEGWPEDEVETA